MLQIRQMFLQQVFGVLERQVSNIANMTLMTSSYISLANISLKCTYCPLLLCPTGVGALGVKGVHTPSFSWKLISVVGGNGVCHIRNEHMNEFLYTGSKSIPSDPHRRYALTWMGNINGDPGSSWEIIPVDPFLIQAEIEEKLLNEEKLHNPEVYTSFFSLHSKCNFVSDM